MMRTPTNPAPANRPAAEHDCHGRVFCGTPRAIAERECPACPPAVEPTPSRAPKPPKWSAAVSIGGQGPFDVEPNPTSDTLAEITRAGRDLAAHLLELFDGEASDASIVIYKQLAADAEPRRDRSIYAYRDLGRVHFQPAGA